MMARVFINATPSSQSVQVQWSRCPIAESHDYCWTWELYRPCLCFFFSSRSTYRGLRRQYRKLKSLGWKLGPSSVTVDILVIVKVYIGLDLFICKIKTHCMFHKEGLFLTVFLEARIQNLKGDVSIKSIIVTSIII